MEQTNERNWRESIEKRLIALERVTMKLEGLLLTESVKKLAKRKPSITTRIEDLKQEGYFNEPRSITDIKEKLGQGGYIYPLQSLTDPLKRAVKGRKLARIGSRGKGRYVKR